jgi:hypothetical protein
MRSRTATGNTLPNQAQADISEAVKDAATARKRATHLLDASRRAVEIAIEEDEKSALQFLRKTV